MTEVVAAFSLRKIAFTNNSFDNFAIYDYDVSFKCPTAMIYEKFVGINAYSTNTIAQNSAINQLCLQIQH